MSMDKKMVSCKMNVYGQEIEVSSERLHIIENVIPEVLKTLGRISEDSSRGRNDNTRCVALYDSLNMPFLKIGFIETAGGRQCGIWDIQNTKTSGGAYFTQDEDIENCLYERLFWFFRSIDAEKLLKGSNNSCSVKTLFCPWGNTEWIELMDVESTTTFE